MTSLRDAAQAALEALEVTRRACFAESTLNKADASIEALRAALAEPNRAQKMRDAGYTRRPTLREMAERVYMERIDMTDREYLELAAKAAGNPVGTSRTGGGLLMANGLYWNPLADDGDALRLAVQLRLDIEFGSNDAVFVGNGTGLSFCTLDPIVATRKTIVRAAAEIGKGME